MRFADALLRQGHLSEQALAAVLLTGERPAHLDRCERCGERAAELNRWLDEVRIAGLESVDAEFPADMLQAQRAQILSRLEQIEQPTARVIAFPRASRDIHPIGGHRVAPGWVGVALAAGLVLGVIGGQLTARMGQAGRPAPLPAAAQTTPRPEAPAVTPAEVTPDDVLRQDLENITLTAFDILSDITPRMVAANAGG